MRVVAANVVGRDREQAGVGADGLFVELMLLRWSPTPSWMNGVPRPAVNVGVPMLVSLQ